MGNLFLFFSFLVLTYVLCACRRGDMTLVDRKMDSSQLFCHVPVTSICGGFSAFHCSASNEKSRRSLLSYKRQITFCFYTYEFSDGFREAVIF